MSTISGANVPGYREAVEKEQELRDLAFLGLPIPLLGFPVRQFTPRHLIILGRMDNAFTNGSEPTAADVLQFAWFVSTEYTLNTKARDKYLKRWWKETEKKDRVGAIREYIGRAFYDAPAGTSQGGKLYTSSVAGMVDIIAHEYGWDDESILEKPLARIFQYMRRIHTRYKPGALMFNRTDRMMSEHLKARLNGKS